MKKFWMGLVASCLVLLSVDSVKADHHSHGNCGVYGGSPYGGRVQTFSSGRIFPGYGVSGGYGGFGGYNNAYRPYGGYYNQGFYGSPGFGPGCRTYGSGYGSGVGFYIRF